MRARILESARTRSNYVNLKYTEDFRQRRRLNGKKLATLHRVVFQVEFSLLLAFLEPLEGSAVESARNVAAVPYNAGSAVPLQWSGFREILTNFLTFVAC